MDPFDPEQSDVWITYMYGFEPETWGFLGFTEGYDLQWFLERSRPGALVAVYVPDSPNGTKELRGKIAGFLEVGSRQGRGEDFMPGDAYAEKQRDPNQHDKWDYALQVTRAWQVEPGQEPEAEAFAPLTLGPSSGKGSKRQLIGRRGEPVHPLELQKFKELLVVEVPVYLGRRSLDTGSAPLSQKLEPSKAVPRTASPYTVDEDDGPKHLYILNLEGNLAHFLDTEEDDVEGMMVIKVGYSKSPQLRCRAFNQAMPVCAFHWEIWKVEPGDPPYPNWQIAQVGEDAMKTSLIEHEAKSLGREFFLCSSGAAYKAWRAGNTEAQKALAP